MIGEYKPEELFTDTFVAYIAKILPAGMHGLESILVNDEIELASKTACSQDSQPIFPKSFFGISDCSDDPIFQIFLSATKIDDLAIIQVNREGIDGKVPSFQVIFKIRDKGHTVGVPSVLVGTFTAEGGYLEAVFLVTHRDRAMVNAGGDDSLEETHDLLWFCIGGKIEVLVVDTQQMVTDGTPYNIKVEACLPELL
jgi:hypothetical protein